MVLETTPSTTMIGPSMKIIVIIGGSLGCLLLLVAALVIACIIRTCRSDHKRIDSSVPDVSMNTVCSTEARPGMNHQNVESHYETVALSTLQASNSRCQTNCNPYMVECGAGRYEISRNSTSPPTIVESKIHGTTQNSKVMMPQHEASAAHIYESITQCSRNIERDPVLKTSPYVTMGMSQVESPYACAQDEYNRNYQEDYELMTPSPPVSPHNDNVSKDVNSPCCSSTSLRFDISPHCDSANASSRGNYSIKTKNTKESLAMNPYVNLGIGSRRPRTEGNVDRCDSKLPRNRDESGYANMTSGVSWHSSNKEGVV